MPRNRKATRAKSDSSAPIEALLYMRVSSGKQVDGASLDVQLRECREYAARHGWVLGSEYVDVLSGRRDDRPRYQEMLSDIRILRSQGKRVCVIVWRLDRLGRRFLERVQTRNALKELGVETHSAMEGHVNDVTANVLASIAEEEVRVLGERVRGIIREIHAGGWHRVSRLPFGYSSRASTPAEKAADAPRRVLDIDPIQALIAHEAFKRLAEGQSIRAIAAWLARTDPVERNGRKWSRRTVTWMLQNPVYIGRLDPDEDGVDPLALPVGKWPRLISDDLWQSAQAQLRLNSKLPRRASTRNLLSVLLKCPREGCDGHMVGQKQEGATPGCARTIRRYRCDKRDPQHRCTGTLPAPGIEDDVMRQVTALLDMAVRLDPEMRRELAREWEALRGASGNPDGRRATERQIRELQAAREQAQKRLANAAVLLLDGTLDKTGYDAARLRVDADLEEIASDLERLEAAMKETALPTLSEMLERIGTWHSALSVADVDTRRQVLIELIARVDARKIRHGEYCASISWTEIGGHLSKLGATQTAAA
jgi:DNA invertase Pin-like site-specific DNA recombinase